jgi:hypothetical protein
LHRWYPRHFVDDTLGRSFSICLPFLKGNEKGLMVLSLKSSYNGILRYNCVEEVPYCFLELSVTLQTKVMQGWKNRVIETYVCEIRAVIAF